MALTETQKLAQKRYRERNRDLIKERSLDYYYRNRDKVLSTTKTWQEQNKDKTAASQKEWRKQNGKSLYQSQRERGLIDEYRLRYTLKNLPKVLYTRAKQRAAAKNISFSITPDDVRIPDVCPVFGTPFVMNTPFAPSLDRIDASKGYEPDNIWVISWRANRIKCDATLEELKAVCSALERLSNQPA